MKSGKGISWWAILFTVVNSIILATVFDLSPSLKLNGNPQSQISVSYADLAAILLTGACVLVTILGVGVAIVTFVGYKQIKDAAISKAEEHVKESIKDEKGELHKLVKQEVQAITYRHLRGTAVSDDWPSEEEGESS